MNQATDEELVSVNASDEARQSLAGGQLKVPPPEVKSLTNTP